MDKDFYFRVETMRKRPQPAKKVSVICEKDHKKLLLELRQGEIGIEMK